MPLSDKYDQLKHKYYATDGTLTADLVIDFTTSLRAGSINGYIVNDGASTLSIKLSDDGTTYGSAIKLQVGDIYSLRNRIIRKVTLVHSGVDTDYRIFAEGDE